MLVPYTKKMRKLPSEESLVCNEKSNGITSDSNDLEFISKLYELCFDEENWYRGQWLKRKKDLEIFYGLLEKYKMDYVIASTIKGLVKKIESDIEKYLKMKEKFENIRTRTNVLDRIRGLNIQDYDVDSKADEIERELNELSDMPMFMDKIIEDKNTLRRIIRENLSKIPLQSYTLE